jgi:tRNA(fMet)-specific endonuclease VapC
MAAWPDDRFPPAYASLFGELRRRGVSVAAMDLLIGTAARVAATPLATRNTRDFERIPGLHVQSY